MRFCVLTTAFTWVITWFSTYAQEEKAFSDSVNMDGGPHLILKTDLFSLLDFYPTVQLGLEYKAYDHLYFENSIGYVFGYWWEADLQGGSGDNLLGIDDIINPKGLKLRTEIKYYFSPFAEGNRFSMYLAPEFVFRYIVSDGIVTQGFRCNNDFFFAQCQFYQYFPYKIKQYQYFANLKGGFQFFSKEKLMFDFFWGTGLKWKHVKNHGKPDAVEGGITVEETFVEEVFSLHLTFGFKIGYILK